MPTPDFYIVPTAALDATADAIREKTGSQASIEFTQDGFADAIEDIESGYSFEQIANHDFSYNGELTLTGTRIYPFAFERAGFTSVSAPNVISFTDSENGTSNGNGGYIFAYCTNLASISFPELTNTGSGGYQFAGCTSLTAVNFPKLAYCGTYMFYGCSNLVTAVLRGNTASNFNGHAFQNCSKLKKVDITSGQRIYTDEFKNASVFDMLVLRKTSAVVSLNTVGAFSGTPFADGGTGGTFYVPNSMIATYQSATNWSTILSYTNNQIKSIESTHTDPDAPIDLTLYYADGTLIPT